MPKVIFIFADKTRQEVEASVGDTLLNVARTNGVRLSGACMGAMVCGLCRVEIDPAWSDKLSPPPPREEIALESTYGATEFSRLGCAIRITPELDGLIVHVP
jgi:2Fe-2S ferredoxin